MASKFDGAAGFGGQSIITKNNNNKQTNIFKLLHFLFLFWGKCLNVVSKLSISFYFYEAIKKYKQKKCVNSGKAGKTKHVLLVHTASDKNKIISSYKKLLKLVQPFLQC